MVLERRNSHWLPVGRKVSNLTCSKGASSRFLRRRPTALALEGLLRARRGGGGPGGSRAVSASLQRPGRARPSDLPRPSRPPARRPFSAEPGATLGREAPPVFSTPFRAGPRRQGADERAPREPRGGRTSGRPSGLYGCGRGPGPRASWTGPLDLRAVGTPQPRQETRVRVGGPRVSSGRGSLREAKKGETGGRPGRANDSRHLSVRVLRGGWRPRGGRRARAGRIAGGLSRCANRGARGGERRTTGLITDSVSTALAGRGAGLRSGREDL